MRFPSRSPSETRAAARELAEEVDASGATVALIGVLGSGKTVFAKGMAEGLGVPEALLPSPTFTIAHELPTPSGLRLVHADLFRVESARELEEAGAEDWMGAGVLLVVEWADRHPEALPPDRLEVRLEPGPGDGERVLAVAALGARAEALRGRWRARRAATGVPLTDCAA
jgi:tRNA threonylcarbamoyladenosine biosynthesis protein TsaE